MKKILFIILIICLTLSTVSFANEIVVSSTSDLITAFTTPTYDLITFADDIVVVNDALGYAPWDAAQLEINGCDRTIDFNGHKMIIQRDEYIKTNYRTHNNLYLTDNTQAQNGGIVATYLDRGYNSLFKLYNFNTDSQLVKMIVNGGTYWNNSRVIFEDTNHFRLIINGGNYMSAEAMFCFNGSYDSDVEINRLSFSLLDGNYIELGIGKLADEFISSKLADGSYCFTIDGEDEWEDITTDYFRTSYNSDCKIVVISEEEAPEGVLLPEIPNIKMEGSIISWDNIDDVNLYGYCFNFWRFDTNVYDLENPSVDVYDLLTAEKEESDTYDIRVYAIDSDNGHISRIYAFKYEYVSPIPKLETPTNLRWEGTMTAAWDAVPNATSYEIEVIRDSSDGVTEFSKIVTDPYIDFSEDCRLSSNKTWYFEITAYADDYRDSDSETCEVGKVGWFVLGTLSNVELSPSGVLKWDAYEGADGYDWLFGYGGGILEHGTSVNLREYAKECGWEAKTYNWRVYAYKNIDDDRYAITEDATGTYTFTLTEKGDMDDNGVVDIIDVRLLLQVYINSSGATEWDEADLELMDMDGSGVIDILDVRILLQKYINS